MLKWLKRKKNLIAELSEMENAIGTLLEEREGLIGHINELTVEAAGNQLKTGVFVPHIDEETGREYIGFHSENGSIVVFASKARSIPSANGFLVEVLDPYSDEEKYYALSGEGNVHELNKNKKIKKLFDEGETQEFSLGLDDFNTRPPIGFILGEDE